MNNIKIISLLSMFCLPIFLQAQDIFNERTYYRLTNSWMGEGRSLDVHPDGMQIMMAPSGNFLGQHWRFEKLDEGVYRLHNMWQRDHRALDIINDGKNNRLASALTGEYSGQVWIVQPLDDGYFRFINGWQQEKALDCDSDKEGWGAYLNPIGNYSGQLWRVEDTGEKYFPNQHNLHIGDEAHGGIVFHIDESKGIGLVCQKEEMDLMSWHEAVAACENLEEGGFADWYLPSLDELQLMYKNLGQAGIGGFDKAWYWSSKKSDELNMYSTNFNNGENVKHWEGDHSHVRAVRTVRLKAKGR